MPPGFSWVERPHLAALAYPDSAEDLRWLRQHGIDVLVSLTEYPAPRHWINEAGIMSVHIPVEDMSAPSEQQFDLILETIRKANQSGMGIAVHCAAGRGRTGTVLAAYFVSQGLSAIEAVEKVRKLRPGSIETAEQVLAVEAFSRKFMTGG